MTFYAHRLKDQPIEQWETMQQHEELVAKYCREFLEEIDPTLELWEDLLGRWHDLRKYFQAFQKSLDKTNDHPAATWTTKSNPWISRKQFDSTGHARRLL